MNSDPRQKQYELLTINNIFLEANFKKILVFLFLIMGFLGCPSIRKWGQIPCS